jgi:DNA transformation protein
MKDESFVKFVEDQLRSLRGLTIKKMFGGYGIYRGEDFFAIIAGGRLYFKIDDKTKQDYIDRGMGPFKATPKQTLKTYYEVPVDVLEDDGELTAWARVAIRCQQATKKKPKAPNRKSRRK